MIRAYRWVQKYKRSRHLCVRVCIAQYHYFGVWFAFNLFFFITLGVWQSFAIHTKITHLKLRNYSRVSSIDCRGVSKVKSDNEFKMIIVFFVGNFVTWIIIYFTSFVVIIGEMSFYNISNERVLWL